MGKQLLRACILVALIGGSMGAIPNVASAHSGWLCDAWQDWEVGGSMFINYRSCIDHTADDVLGRTEVFITWNSISVPDFEYLGLVTQIQKNTGTWTTKTSDVCDRTNGAQNPGAHDTAGTALGCNAPKANRTNGDWRVRQNVCWDLVPGAFRCLTDTAAGFNFSPIHAL
jgi:hypothetical protein